MPDRSRQVCVGQFGGAHGVRGLVRLRSFTAEPEAVAAYGPLAGEDGRSFTFELVGRVKDAFLARLPGVGDRDQADALKGVRLYVDRERLPPAEEEEYYHADLIGLTAERPDGTVMGRVAAVHDFGAGDVLEIRGDAGSVMVPFTRDAVPAVDLAAGRLTVEAAV